MKKTVTRSKTDFNISTSTESTIGSGSFSTFERIQTILYHEFLETGQTVTAHDNQQLTHLNGALKEKR